MTCSYRTCGNRLPTARLPERPQSVRLSGTLCRVLGVLAAAGVRRRHPMAGADAPGPAQKRIITGSLVGWATRGGGGTGQAADAVRSALDKCLPGRWRSSVLNSAAASSAAALNADSERATDRPQIVQLFCSATGNRRGSGTR